MRKEIVIIGASDVFDLVAATYQSTGGVIVGYSALQEETRSNYSEYRWLGSEILEIRKCVPDAAFVLGLSSNIRRQSIFKEVLGSGGELLSALHPKAEIYKSATIGRGVLVQPFSTVSSCSRLGDGCYVNYGALVGHDVIVESFSFIGPGAKLLGESSIGQNVFIGAGAIILPRVKVGAGAKIAAGVTVRRDVPAGSSVMPRSSNRILG